MMRELKRFVTMMLATAVVATSVPVISDAATVDYYNNGVKEHSVTVSGSSISVNDYHVDDKHFEGWTLSGNTVSAIYTVSGNVVVSVNALYSQCDMGDVDETPATCTKDGKSVVKCSVCGEVKSTRTISKLGHKWNDGKVTKEATTTEEGVKTYECTVCGETKTEKIEKKKAEKCTEHKWNEGEVTKEATTTEEGVKTYKCTVCGETKTEAIAKLPVPTIKLNAKSIKLQKGKSTTAIVASGLIEGDKVASWKSSDTKIVTVSKKGKITAKKVGKATITVTTAKGAKATLKVTVQKKAVKLTKLTVNKKKVTLKVGKKHIIVATKTPLTAQDNVTYKSSNKKVATVSKKGVVTAKKKGTATITVKAGSKTVKVKVTVKKATKKK